MKIVQYRKIFPLVAFFLVSGWILAQPALARKPFRDRKKFQELFKRKNRVTSSLPQKSMDHNGRERIYYLYLPQREDPSRSIPLVIALHGGGGSGPQMERQTGFNSLAGQETFAVVYPEAVDFPDAKLNWNDGRQIFEYPAHRENVDDVGFLSALIDRLVKDHSIDPDRVYVTGISNGGLMAYRLACELAEKVAAIAAVVANLHEEGAAQCRPSRPISVLMMHGTEDPLMVWKGGQMRLPGKDWTWGSLSAPETVQYWAAFNGCPPVPAVTQLPDRDPEDGVRIRKELYGPGQQGVEVVHYILEGFGHNWPGHKFPFLPESLVGATTYDMDASQAIWAFFKQHRRAGSPPKERDNRG